MKVIIAMQAFMLRLNFSGALRISLPNIVQKIVTSFVILVSAPFIHL